MSRLLIVALLAAAVPGSSVFAGVLPWFHKPKPVILEDSAPPPTTRVAYHGTAVYPKTGRLYFDDSRDRTKQAQSSKFHLPDVFPINLLNGPQASKPASTRTK